MVDLRSSIGENTLKNPHFSRRRVPSTGNITTFIDITGLGALVAKTIAGDAAWPPTGRHGEPRPESSNIGAGKGIEYSSINSMPEYAKSQAGRWDG